MKLAIESSSLPSLVLIAAVGLLVGCSTSDDEPASPFSGGAPTATGGTGAGATPSGFAGALDNGYDLSDRVAPSPSPPGGLSVEQVPMFVTIGFDDNGYSGAEGAANVGGVQWAIDLLAARTNPAGSGNAATFDGTPITMSFYSDKYAGCPNATHTERQEAIEEFIDYALSHPEVRVVTMKQILDWVRNPVPLE